MKKKRLIAFFIDIVIIIGISSTLISVLYLLSVEKWIIYLLEIISLTLLFCKDSFTGRSLGKKILDMIVIHDNKPVQPIRALCHNLFYAIWPIELLSLIFFGKRLGDIICECEVIEKPKDIKVDFNMFGVVLFVGIVIIICLAFYFFVNANPLVRLLFSC